MKTFSKTVNILYFVYIHISEAIFIHSNKPFASLFPPEN